MSPLHERATDTVSWGFQVAAAWALRFLLVVAALFVLLTLLNSVSLVTITVAVAIMISALLQPGVELLTHYGVPRILAAILVFVLGMTTLVGAAWFVVQQVSANSSELGGQLLDAVGKIRNWLVTGPPKMSEHQVHQLIDDLTKTITENRASLAPGRLCHRQQRPRRRRRGGLLPVRDLVPADRRRRVSGGGSCGSSRSRPGPRWPTRATWPGGR